MSETVTRVFCASSALGLVTVTAALDAGVFGGRDERRVLIVANTAPIPEIEPALHERPALASLIARFDEVVDWNAVIAPLHPAHWVPDADELPMLGRLLGDRLGVRDGVTELVVESATDGPGRVLGSVVPDCPVTVCAGDIGGYGPTRTALADFIGRRAGRQLHIDLLGSGHRPLHLSEYGVEHEVVPADHVRRVIDEVAAANPAPVTAQVTAQAGAQPAGEAVGAPVIVGQDLARAGAFDRETELGIYTAMLDALAAGGATQVVFLPHPAARDDHPAALANAARRGGITLVVPDDHTLAEAWFATHTPRLVVSTCSTALFTANRLFGLPVATLGTGTVLEQITPYENPLRIALTIADAGLGRLETDGTITPPPGCDVAALTDAVAYCMQPRRLPALHDAAARVIGHFADEQVRRYFKRRRLESVGLVARPAGAVASSPTPKQPRAGQVVAAPGRRLRDAVVARASRARGSRT